MSLAAAATRARLAELAAAIGFDAMAVARVAPLPDPHPAAYAAFLAHGFPADMTYLADHPAARVDPATRWPWAQSVLVLAVHYDRGEAASATEQASGYRIAPPPLPLRADAHTAPAAADAGATPPKPVDTIARYARGRDYHRALDNALRLFKDAIVHTPELGIARAHYHCDTGPVLERPWAHQAGLGWQAKNGLIIRPGAGSFLFLAELFLDRELPPDAPATDHCGSCTRCIDACPTGAIVADRVVDPRKCIPWLNIEKRQAQTTADTAKLHGWLFGCDLCQNVCPHNSRLPVSGLMATGNEPNHALPRTFTAAPVGAPVALPWYLHADRPLRKILGPELWQPTSALHDLTWAEAAALSPAAFEQLKRGTALRRVPYENFIANAKACAAFWQASNNT